MSKFKVGDRVRRVAESTVSGGCFGKVGVDYTIAAPASVLSGNWRSECGIRISEDYFVLADTSPVRSVIRKEIVEGVYGRVKVNDTGKTGLVGLWFEGHYFKPAELRAISETALALADALDEVA